MIFGKLHKNLKRANTILIAENESPVKFMKKHWGVFRLTETIILTGTLAAALALSGAHWTLSVLACVSGIIGAAAYWLHFRSLEYSLENGSIVIRKGFLIKSRQTIPLESVLITQSLTVFGYVLLSSVKTAGGGAVLFCDTEWLRDSSA